MLKKRRESDLKKVLSTIYFSLLIYNVLGHSVISPYREQAEITTKLTLYISPFILIYIFNKEKRYSTEYINIYKGILALSGIYLYSHIVNENYIQNEQLLVLNLTFIFIIMIMKINWDFEHLFVFGLLANFCISFFLFHWVSNGYTSQLYKGVFSNPNVFAAFLFSLLYFQIINIKNKKLFIKIFFTLGTSITFLLILMTTSRTVILCIGIIFSARIVLKVSRKMFSKLFFLIIGGNFFFFSLYVILARSPYVDNINKLSYQYTQKPFFSGRENIWGGVLDYGMKSPIIGHKVAIQIKEYLPNIPYYHTHNQYLQIFVESGFLGLFFFLLFLYFIWKIYLKNLGSHYVQWSASFFLGLLVYQNIEISFFFNMMSIGLIQWLIISVGVSKSIKQEKYYHTN